MGDAQGGALSARARLVVAFVLAFGIAAVQGLTLLPVVAVLAGLALAMAPGRRALLRRLRPAALLALAFLVALPLLTGTTPLLRLGWLTLTVEGAEAGLLVATRLLAIVTLTVVLLAPVPPFALVGAMRAMGLPGLMADLALLTLRYLDELKAELGRARLARRLRGGRARLRDLPDHALLLATALIRAQARSERLWAAMRLRGHGATLGPPAPGPGTRDRAAMAAALALALALPALDRGL